MKKLLITAIVAILMLNLGGCFSKEVGTNIRASTDNVQTKEDKAETLAKFKKFISEIGKQSLKMSKRGPYTGITYIVKEGIYVTSGSSILFYSIDNIFTMNDAQLFDILEKFDVVKNNDTLKSHFIYDSKALSYKQIESGISDFYGTSAKEAWTILTGDLTVKEVVNGVIVADKSPDGLLPRVATLTLSTNAQVFDITNTVKISNVTTGATVYYTIDGSIPTAASSVYSDITGIVLSKTSTVSAMAVKAGNTNSLIVSAKYTIREKVAKPIIVSAVGTTFVTAQTIYVNCTTAGSEIRYTLDNSEPTTASALYTGSILVATSETLKVKAFKQDFISSDTTTASYIITGKLLTPVISKTTGTYTTTQTITIASDNVGAEIRYTLDNTEPTSTSTLYTGTITVSTTKVIRAKAFKTDWTTSDEAKSTISIAELGIVLGTSKSTMGFVYYPVTVSTINSNVKTIEIWAVGSVRDVLRTSIGITGTSGTGSIVIPSNITKVYLIGKDVGGNVIVQKQLEITIQ